MLSPEKDNLLLNQPCVEKWIQDDDDAHRSCVEDENDDRGRSELLERATLLLFCCSYSPQPVRDQVFSLVGNVVLVSTVYM